ncbi:unnamed protein product [Caenorhabditis auriculariae]|uniref:Uncharacterized protein n=1 Tax=Caenorhabditis auriculariae TaxID=2777116 RepID=A0A8S1HW96_9PELO|nr:unnamed protein product [Caenorhabditis auriculariae]
MTRAEAKVIIRELEQMDLTNQQKPSSRARRPLQPFAASRRRPEAIGVIGGRGKPSLPRESFFANGTRIADRPGSCRWFSVAAGRPAAAQASARRVSEHIRAHSCP